MATPLKDITDSAATILATIAGVKVQHYAGEFVDVDTLKGNTGLLCQFPFLMYDVETVEQVDTDSTRSLPVMRMTMIVYATNSNAFDQALQWQGSYELAFLALAALVGCEVISVTNAADSGFQGLEINREFHTPNLSVHSVRFTYDFIADLKAL